MIVPRMITRLKPINGITPFTYRNGLTYLEILERISCYIQDVLVGEINEKLMEIDAQQDQLVDAFNELMEDTKSEIDRLIADTRAELDGMATEYDERFQALEGVINNQITAINSLIEQVEGLNDSLIDKLAELDEKINEIDERLEYITWVTPGVPTQFVQLGVNTTTLEFNDLWAGWPIEYVIRQDGTGIRNNILWPSRYEGFKAIRTGPNVETKIRVEPTDSVSTKLTFNTEYYALHNDSRYLVYDQGRQFVDADGLYNAFVVAAVDGNDRTMIAYAKYTDHFGGGTGLTVKHRQLGGEWVSATNVPRPDPMSTSYGTTGLCRIGNNGFGLMIHHSNPYRMFFTKTTNATSWVAPVLVSNRFGSSLAWIDDGTSDGLLMATSYWGDNISVHVSTNGGANWSVRSTIPQMSGAGNPLNESSILHTGGSDLIMVIRYSPDSEVTNKFMISRSSDMGLTWSVPTEIANEVSGQPRLQRLPNGDIITPIRRMAALNQRKGWGYLTSRDNGVTWSPMFNMRDGLQLYGQFAVTSTGKVTLYGATQLNPNRSDVWEAATELTLGVDQTSLDTLWMPMNVHSYITPSYTLGYRKINGVVYFRGAFTSSSVPNPGPITLLTNNLEEWARPPQPRRFLLAQAVNSGGKAAAMLEVSSTGHIGFSRGPGAAGDPLDTVFYLDSVSYALY